MSTICRNITQIKQEIGNVQLCVVSKYRTIDELHDVYDCNHRIFGENRVQELVSKYEELPKDIEWHLIGHLQSNKVKYIAPFVSLIHSVDSLKLLKQISKEAVKHNRQIDFLLQLHVAQEETKYGLSIEEADTLLANEEYKLLPNISCKGIMGMASLTSDHEQIQKEFKLLAHFFQKHREQYSWNTLSMGMSGDYTLAIDEGSTIIRVGSKVFNT